MSEPDNPLSDGDIEASNVRPAFEASLRFGASETEISETVGWTRAELERDGAHVSGESTYAHMELMARKPDYAGFVVDAVERHTPSSLGIVGLACKSAATVGEAMTWHQRFQHLTNRTARYHTQLDGARLQLSEERFGEPRPGSLLISDYTMLVAVQLLRTIAREPPRILAWSSRRAAITSDERERYRALADVEIETGAERAALDLDASLLLSPVSSADEEMATYFRRVLGRGVAARLLWAYYSATRARDVTP